MNRVSFQGTLYRALNPVWAADPLSGEGARRYGGRFNPKGLAALYTALRPDTAIREANQVGDLQPTLLVAYRADLTDIFDTRLPGAMRGSGFSMAKLADDNWRAQMLERGKAPTQSFAHKLHGQGYIGMITPSYARGARKDDSNLVLWIWPGLSVIDDENRLL